VGIFSLFGKKDDQPARPEDSSRAKRQISTSRPESGKTTTRPVSVRRDAQAARATALKIDAIESEMSSEFVTTTRSGNTLPPQTTGTPPPPKATPPAPAKADASMPATAPLEAVPTLQPMSTEMGTTTQFLLKGQTAVGNVASLSSEAAAVIEETAIMYANGQSDLVGQMLRSAIDEDRLGDAAMKAWWMLFDLYQITGKKQEFEQLSIAYVNKFETSPPTWHEQGKTVAEQGAPTGATPMVPFSGKLDASSVKPIERIQKLAENYRSLRLEFARVAEVDPEGCRLLLALLKKLQKSGHELILVGASELAGKIRAILEVGRRDHEDSWLLLLEILQLLNREQEFEEASIDYCVTFEVSPPAFVAPQNVTTATAETPLEAPEEGFMMPALVEGRIDNLILAIAAYSDAHSPAIIDCSQLTRVDFTAAGRLLTGLAPFCGNGKVLEFHHVNHLVDELFRVIGLHDIARVVPRKN
jgi:ABC-type transporter Mla MlaB component